MIDVRSAIRQTEPPPYAVWNLVVPLAIARCLSILLLFSLVFPLPLRAAASLYTGEVPVSSQSEGERTEALKNALAQVIVKVSGDNGLLTQPAIVKAIASADHYVQQYQYAQNVVTDAGQPQVRLTLIAQFDRDAVDQLLRDAGAGHGATGETAATPAETPSGTYRVWVGGVGSAEDYARLIGALSRNELVRGVQVELARGDGVELRIDATVSLARLLDSLGNGPVRVVNAKPPVEGVDALLGMQP
ncbi:MAG TPA: DUF2066 domain-containing protein [Rudaea sp.]|nr:DUF2066 domain-containing protein [Rudaea sp.]